MRHRRLLSCLALLLAASIGHVSAAEFIPLGSLSDFPEFTRPQDISAAGDIVVGDYGFIWRDGQGMTTLPDLEDGSFKGISHDGATIVGSMPNRLGFVYSEASGLTLLPDVNPRGVSGDGDIVVGNEFSEGPNGTARFEAVRWTADFGIEPLGFLGVGPDGVDRRSFAEGISDDGSTIVGYSTHADSSSRAVLWRNNAISPVGTSAEEVTVAQLVDGTGASIAGWVRNEDSSVGAVVWNDGQRSSLGTLNGFLETNVRGISADGTTIVGFGRTLEGQAPFIWTKSEGMESLQDELTTRYGLEDSLTGWQLLTATALSPNGLFIAGRGINPDGVPEGYLVRLPAVPEPSSMALLSIALAGGMLAIRKGVST